MQVLISTISLSFSPPPFSLLSSLSLCLTQFSLKIYEFVLRSKVIDKLYVTSSSISPLFTKGVISRV